MQNDRKDFSYKSGYPVKWFRSEITPVDAHFSDSSSSEVGADVEWKSKYESLIQASGEVLYEWTAADNRSVFMGGLTEMLGYDLSEMGFSLFQWIDKIHPEDKVGFYDNLKLAYEKKQIFDWTFRVRHKSGKYIHVRDRGEFHFDNDGNLMGMTGFLRDISSDVQKKQEYDSLLSKHKSICAELENFSRTISKDLREPIRSVESLSQYLFEFAGQPLQVQKINPEVLVMKVHQCLVKKYPGRKVEFLLHKLPIIEVDARLFEIVLFHLFENAWKFTRNTVKARIEIGTEILNGKLVFYVRDNGAGFDVSNQEKLFGVFQRFHKNNDFEGNGIGLALVKKVIDRHGGRIWVESKSGQGATFYFTLLL